MGVGLVGTVERTSPGRSTDVKTREAMHKQPARSRLQKLPPPAQHHHSLFSWVTYTELRILSRLSTTTRTASRTVARRSTFTDFNSKHVFVQLSSLFSSFPPSSRLAPALSHLQLHLVCTFPLPLHVVSNLTSPRRHGLPRRRPRQPAVQRAHVTVDFTRKFPVELSWRQAHSVTTSRNPPLRRAAHNVPQSQDFVAHRPEPTYTSTLAGKLTERLASTRRCRLLHAFRQGRPSARQATTRRTKGAHHAISGPAP
jgi:hypothetical protein